MPYLAESEKEKEQGQEVGGAPVLSGTSGQPINQPTAPAQGEPTKSGSWTNLTDYLTANKGEGGRMAGQVAEKQIAQPYQQAAKGLGDVANEFKTAAAQGVQKDEALVNKVSSAPTQATEQEKSTYKSMLNPSYQGKETLADTGGYQEVLNAIGRQKANREASGTEAGRTQLLSETYKRPTYNTGEKSLDQMLTQNDPEAQGKLAAARDTYSDLADKQSKAESEATGLASSRKQELADIGTSTKGALTGGIQSTLNAVGSQASAIKTSRQAEIDAALAKYSGGAKAGTYGVDPMKYLSVGQAGVTNNQAVNSDQLAYLNAMKELAGNNSDLINGGATSLMSTGKQGVDAATSYDAAGFENDVQGGFRQYTNEVTPLNNQIQQIRASIPNFGTSPQDQVLKRSAEQAAERRMAPIRAQINAINAKYNLA